MYNLSKGSNFSIYIGNRYFNGRVMFDQTFIMLSKYPNVLLQAYVIVFLFFKKAGKLFSPKSILLSPHKAYVRPSS